MLELNAVQARVVGSLAEKQLTTPQQYPLTLNALVLACNQSSNRDPVVSYDEETVHGALSSLKEGGLVRFVLPSHGRSVIRYRQVLDERFGLDARGLSVVAVLMLRGPQTIGELRARTERMADFDALGDVEAELERLASGSDPLVRRLPRRPGQKEERWAQLLTGEASEPEPASELGTSPDQPPIPVASSSVADGVAALRADLDAVREELAAMRAVVDELRAAFDL
jgi:uncharacterized protein